MLRGEGDLHSLQNSFLVYCQVPEIMLLLFLFYALLPYAQLSLEGVKSLFVSVGLAVLKSPRYLLKWGFGTKTLRTRNLGICISTAPQVIFSPTKD